MSKKILVIFIPSIESGGVEKNLFIISNYLANHLITKVVLITSEVEIIKNLLSRIEILEAKVRIRQALRYLNKLSFKYIWRSQKFKRKLILNAATK